MKDKQRLDKYLAEKDYFPSRTKAKRAIMAGEVYVNGELVDKAGTPIQKSDDIEIKGDGLPYVSRGGLKLEKALQSFSISPNNKEAIDVGASTGGFTDCLLQQGAARVYAIDVGYGQLAWKLRQDKRVKVIERTNFRYFTREDLDVVVPLIVVDVSFISLKLIIPQALPFLKKGGEIIALIKPQFEAGRERVGKNGVVREKDIHIDVIRELVTFFKSQNLEVKALDYSPITGASEKNIEFLVYLQKPRNNSKMISQSLTDDKIERIVNLAHRDLGRG